ncbi:alpha,alpha-trehalose-phosphate synthase [UDP-forming] 1-like isoform X2 [Cicer arietinum]|uniref:alpha,alpha-trehalose-phosphate synthase (UDP-forming) n=1 Tax=Cicer arietinum TaxID=3827 RepID=A0A3Q7WYF7_CICAR|nr:alpha,alpha-trehalose-phosphate synthase [UDP-forming] 1-like isoform X2 [Cicer arietinum]
MPGNTYNGDSNHIPGRVERLLRERELRKSGRENNGSEVVYLEKEEKNNVSSLLRSGERQEDVVGKGEGCYNSNNNNRQRLLVVANRLPVSAIRKGEDSWSLEISAGGLVSALLGVKEFEARWIGWAGVNVPDEIGQKALTVALAEKRCIPVFLDEDIVHQYYNGYCNNILWPLFHYLGLPQEDRLATTRSFQSQFLAYEKANQMFADVVNQHYEEGDVVWCHDYHLMFLPKCLKKYNTKMKVGWFLHTPFPSSEIHRTLPSRSELLHSVLAADLVGFHTYDYARHFVSACTRILGLEGTPYGVEYQGKLTRVAAFPIGIDSERFIRALDLPPVQDHIKELQERFKGRKDRSLDFHELCALYAVTDVALVTSLRDGMNLVSYEFVACQEKKKGVLILSEFAGAAQSLGAGAILVNPWNVTEVATAIARALNMLPAEREKRHKHNFLHVKSHTAQEWAGTFVSELNDTVIEAQLRTRQVPPPLPTEIAVNRYLQSTNRLLILGFNGTLTEPVEKTGDQIKEMELKVHPKLRQPLKALCSDPNTTVVVLSGSGRKVLDDNFKEYDMWLAAENGMFLHPSKGEWMTTMPEHLNMEWVDSVKHVFEYFTERTPRSHFDFEERETSLLWNYKYADVEFGKLQARDMLQHLWTGPISNSSVEVVQGSRSVEVRAVGVTKGAAIDRILGEIVHSKSMTSPIDYVLCIGHFLGKDEDLYTFFEPDLPYIGVGLPRSKVTTEAVKFPVEKKPIMKTPSASSKNGPKSSQNKAQKPVSNSAPEKESWNVLDLKKDNYFSCAVGRTRTNARYTLASPDHVVEFLMELADAQSLSSG